MEYQGQELTTQKDIERVLFKVNHAKIRASDDTMFMLEPMRSIFGYRGYTPAMEQVLDGTFPTPPDIEEAGHLLLKSLQRPVPKEGVQVPVRKVITTEE